MNAGGGVPILVVDDSAATRRGIADTLRACGHEVTEAGSGAEAIQALKSRGYHVMTLDIEMPVLNGIEVLRLVKGIDPDLFVVMISNVGALKTAVHALRLGAFDYISKPFEAEELVLAVERALAQRSLVLENRRLIADLRSLNERLEELVQRRTGELAQAHEELVRRHRELEESHRKLKELDVMKSKFVTITSHELLTPLTIIKGFSELIASGVCAEPQKMARAIHAIGQSVDRLASIVGAITDIARLREKRRVFSRDEVRIQDEARSVADEVEPFVAKRGQVLSVDLPLELPPVCGDAQLLRQVLTHLLLNAIRYTPDGGSIALAAVVEDDEGRRSVHVTVRDTGIGIPRDQMEKIFEPFYEAAAARHHHSGTIQFGSSGLGLGLTMVREVAEEHGGRVWAESPPSGGAVFHLLLPCAGAPAPSLG